MVSTYMLSFFHNKYLKSIWTLLYVQEVLPMLYSNLLHIIDQGLLDMQ